MTPLLNADIAVTLRVCRGNVEAVDIRSTRLTQASQMLAGRRPADITAILPAVFALCGTAQALAGLAAIEAACGRQPGSAQRMARRFLLLTETVGEHCLSILRDWPPLVGDPPDLATAKGLRPLVAAAKRALYPAGGWARPGGGRLVIDRAALADQVRRMEEITAGLCAGSPDWLDDDAMFHATVDRGDGVAGRLLHRVRTAGLAGFGRSPLPPMPDGGPQDLAQRLEADRDGAYLARPDCQGRALETGPLSRQAAHPMLAGLLAEHGNGLLARLTARLAEMASALRELNQLVQDLCDHPGTPDEVVGSGSGIGQVDAARGLLVHRVEMTEGVVGRYQILAPTEWNFHPDGPLARGLKGTAAGPDLMWRAKLLAAAHDPCVACRITVE
jgi:uptake hydrogenase large subunit